LPHQKSTIRHLKSIFYLLLLPCALSLGPCASDAIGASVTLGWDSNPEPDLEGYVVYRNVGSPGPPYDYSDTLPEDELVDPLHPKATLTELKEGNQYYIALTAYNTDGTESDFSDDVCVEVINGAIEACSASVAPVASTVSGSGGSGNGSNSCFISASSGESSMFSKFVAAPNSSGRILVITLLLLSVITAVIPKKARKLERLKA
jgi:hypothetical protein